MKSDFTPFKIGTVFNPINIKAEIPKYRFVKISYPSRLNAMALDSSKITHNDNLQYSPGEILFKVKLYKEVTIEVTDSPKFDISETSHRKPLILHSAIIMRKALGFKNGLKIFVKNNHDIRHVGLGSSSGLIASVACAINELYGNPINKEILLQYLAQNHGEEIANNIIELSPVQCIGGSAAAGLYKGGLIILAGKSKVIYSAVISDKFKIVIGIPKNFQKLDAQTLLEQEIKSFPKFIKCGLKYSPKIAYSLIHNVLPSLKDNNLKPLGDLIYDYRFKMGSINNCSYCYKKLSIIADKIAYIKEKNIADILSLSSVGPSFFALTDKTAECIKIFNKANLRTIVTDVENHTYSILGKF